MLDLDFGEVYKLLKDFEELQWFCSLRIFWPGKLPFGDDHECIYREYKWKHGRIDLVANFYHMALGGYCYKHFCDQFYLFIMMIQ